MRIGIDYTSALGQGAGIGRYTRGLVSALATLDRENQYTLAWAPGAANPALPELPPNFTLRRLPFNARVGTILWQRLRLPLPVEWLTGPLDVFHAPDFVLPPVSRARTVVTVHDLTFMVRPECADPALRAYLEQAVSRSVARADLILGDSANTKSDLMRLLGVPASKIEVVYPGVDAGRFAAPVAPETLAEMRHLLGLNEPYILFVGTIEPRKNLPRLVRAYARLRERVPNAPLLALVGRRGWLSDELFATIAQCGLEERVRLADYAPDELLPALYQGAELFVFPTLYEGFGIPPLEAMASGTPVVCSSAPPMPEVVGDAALLFDPEDDAAFAAALERALTDTTLRADLTARGRDRAARFTWEDSARTLKGLYESLAR